MGSRIYFVLKGYKNKKAKQKTFLGGIYQQHGGYLSDSLNFSSLMISQIKKRIRQKNYYNEKEFGIIDMANIFYKLKVLPELHHLEYLLYKYKEDVKNLFIYNNYISDYIKEMKENIYLYKFLRDNNDSLFLDPITLSDDMFGFLPTIDYSDFESFSKEIYENSKIVHRMFDPSFCDFCIIFDINDFTIDLTYLFMGIDSLNYLFNNNIGKRKEKCIKDNFESLKNNKDYSLIDLSKNKYFKIKEAYASPFKFSFTDFENIIKDYLLDFYYEDRKNIFCYKDIILKNE